MNANKISHLVVHDLALAQLKCQILVILISLRGLGVLPYVIYNQLSLMIHDVRAHCNKTKLLCSIHNVPGSLLLRLLNGMHVHLVHLLMDILVDAFLKIWIVVIVDFVLLLDSLLRLVVRVGQRDWRLRLHLALAHMPVHLVVEVYVLGLLGILRYIIMIIIQMSLL